MSRRQRLTRATLAVAATLCGVLCVLSAAALTWAFTPVEETALLATLWASGVAGLGLSILACRVDDDSTDDPHYFGSIVRGLRDEWHHDSAA
jgi:hypothetical protein